MSLFADRLKEETRVIPLGSLGRMSHIAKASKNNSRVFIATLFAFVVILLLLLLLMGMNVYSSLNSQRETSDTSRLSLSLIASIVKMNDSADVVSKGAGPEGPALVLTEHLEAETYETRIYAYRGMIVEEYSSAEQEYDPDNAQVIAASKTFSFEYADRLLTIHTDAGDGCIMIRGHEGVLDES